jgi:Major intrinsic protein
MLGAMASAGVVAALFPGPLAVTTSLSGGTSLAQGLFIEMILTAQLVFTIIMLAAEKHKSTFLAPVGIGLSLFIAELGGLCSSSFSPLSVERLILLRSLLHGWISQPGQKLRPLRSKPFISNRTLDLLVGSCPGVIARSGVLLVYQNLRV